MNTDNSSRYDSVMAVLLAATAGYTDTVGFVALFGLFTAHVTGNFVVLGAALANNGHGLLIKFLALPVFMLTIAIGRILERTLCRKNIRTDIPLLAMQVLLLIGFLVIAEAAGPNATAESSITILAGMLGVAAMSFQNLSAKAIFAKMPPTTVMTGNVTQLMIDLTDLLIKEGEQERQATIARLKKMLPPILSFAIGALFGGVAFMTYGFYCLLFPIFAIIGVIALRVKD
jgi:uncharacterized membrane protein YoaK (UPF0700 family)